MGSSLFDQTSFCFGVMLSFFSFWFVGRYPEYYFILHAIKGLGYYGFLLKKRLKVNEHWYFTDFCWVHSFLVIVRIWMILFQYYILDQTQIVSTLEVTVMFAVHNSVLAGAAVVLRNAFVFHSLDHLASCYIHFSPMVLSFCVRWHQSEMNAAFPGLFVEESFSSPGLTSYIFDSINWYFLWWAPYYTWLYLFGIDYPKCGYDTVWNYTNKSMKIGKMFEGWFGTKSEGNHIILYAIAHGFFANLPTLLTYPMWHFEFLHLVFTSIILSCCVKAAASYYKYVYGKAYVKHLKKQKNVKMEQ